MYESVGCPCLPLEGFTQILVRYLHGFFAHLFCLQAEAGRDRLKRKGSQECFAKVLPVVFHFLLVSAAAGGDAEGEAKAADNPLLSHSHEGI